MSAAEVSRKLWMKGLNAEYLPTRGDEWLASLEW